MTDETRGQCEISDFKSCPHCGSDEGYYTSVYVSGWVRDRRFFDGEPNNPELFDHLNFSRETKYYQCASCDKRICKREPVKQARIEKELEKLRDETPTL